MMAVLAAQGAVFALWAFVAFRALFRLLGVMQAQSGQSVPGFRALIKAPLVFWHEPSFAHDRRLMAWLTLILLALTLGFAAVR